MDIFKDQNRKSFVVLDSFTFEFLDQSDGRFALLPQLRVSLNLNRYSKALLSLQSKDFKTVEITWRRFQLDTFYLWSEEFLIRVVFQLDQETVWPSLLLLFLLCNQDRFIAASQFYILWVNHPLHVVHSVQQTDFCQWKHTDLNTPGLLRDLNYLFKSIPNYFCFNCKNLLSLFTIQCHCCPVWVLLPELWASHYDPSINLQTPTKGFQDIFSYMRSEPRCQS